MITYELMVLFRVMPKPELIGSLKRSAQLIYDKGGVIRKLENLGTRDMPYKTSNHGVVYNRASYYLFQFNVPPFSIQEILEEYGRDIDIIRRRIFKKNEPIKEDCSLHKELLPAPYRKDVEELIREAKRYDKPKFKYNSGLDYYPFQK